MEIANPEAFLLLGLLALITVFLFRRGVRFRSRIYTPTDSWMSQRPRFALPSPFKFHVIMRVLALSLLIVGLSRPQKVSTKVKRLVEALDMVICFDLSKSMDALDFTPNRRTVAIDTISRFIDRRADDRIGLVLFSGEAYTAVPITLDHSIVKSAIKKSSNAYLEDGTAIGQSLAVAVNHLKDSRAKSRIVILVTDGDNNMGSVDPMTAADLAKSFGIRVYTIGLGKKGKVQFPVTYRDALGREHTRLDTLDNASNDELLVEIAKHTNGEFYSATRQEMLEQVFANIDKLEKTEVETQTFVKKSELAWPWILAGFFVLLLEGLGLHTRWRKLP